MRAVQSFACVSMEVRLCRNSGPGRICRAECSFYFFECILFAVQKRLELTAMSSTSGPKAICLPLSSLSTFSHSGRTCSTEWETRMVVAPVGASRIVCFFRKALGQILKPDPLFTAHILIAFFLHKRVTQKKQGRRFFIWNCTAV